METQFNNYLKQIGRNIKSARKRCKLRQIDIEEKIGLTYRHFQSIEAGRINVTLETLHRLSKLFNMEVSQLVSLPKPTQPQLAGISLLIVDDEPDIRELLADEFKGRGCEVLTASGSRAAFDILRTRRIDAVITDVRMPEVDGVTLLNWVKDHNGNIPVLFVTGFSDLDADEAYHQGSEGLFSKPFDMESLAKRVEQSVKEKRDRWKEPPETKPRRNIERRFPALTAARQGGIFELGRGGMYVALNEALPLPGEELGFKISLESGDLRSIEGTGIVRWVRPASAQKGPAACGIEFKYLDDPTRSSLINWIDTQKSRPYIPKA